jgi:hypothetical protein
MKTPSTYLAGITMWAAMTLTAVLTLAIPEYTNAAGEEVVLPSGYTRVSLPPLHGSTGTFAFDIDNGELIVGYSFLLMWPCFGIEGADRGFLKKARTEVSRKPWLSALVVP